MFKTSETAKYEKQTFNLHLYGRRVPKFQKLLRFLFD